MSNKEYLRTFERNGKDDYIRNGYKKYELHEKMQRILTDITRLKYRYNKHKI